MQVKVDGAPVYIENGDSYYARVDETTTMEVPKSNNNVISTTPKAVRPYKFNKWHIVMFEDTKDGDFDYNDIVMHVCMRKYNNGNSYLYVHPIALGSSKKIGFGIKVNGKDVFYTSDCRSDFFHSIKGFINTVKNGLRVKFDEYKTVKLDDDIMKSTIEYYIVVDGKTVLPAISKNQKTRYYGLIVTNLGQSFKYKGVAVGADWFDYPSEHVSINSAYPDFMQTNGNFDSFLKNMNSKYCYDAIRLNDNGEIADDCLYLLGTITE